MIEILSVCDIAGLKDQSVVTVKVNEGVEFAPEAVKLDEKPGDEDGDDLKEEA